MHTLSNPVPIELVNPGQEWTYALIQRRLDFPFTVQGKRLIERRGEWGLAQWDGLRWLNRRQHWDSWSQIPPAPYWNPPELMLPPDDNTVLLLLPEQIFYPSSISVDSPIVFGRCSSTQFRSGPSAWELKTRVQRDRGNREAEWLPVASRQISGWLPLPRSRVAIAKGNNDA